MQAERGRSASRERELWRRFRAAGDPRAREELIEIHMPMARRMAARYAGVAEPFDDLLQVAGLGLVNAVDRFDPARGVPFLLAKIEHANRQSIGRLGRAATVEELAAQLEVSSTEILDALEAGRNRSPISLDAPSPEGDDDDGAAEWVGRPDHAFERAEDRVALRALLPGLDPREQEILRLRFVEDMPQTAIAERIGCSQMQISRLLQRTLERLREEAGGAMTVGAA